MSGELRMLSGNRFLREFFNSAGPDTELAKV